MLVAEQWSQPMLIYLIVGWIVIEYWTIHGIGESKEPNIEGGVWQN
jgi:hypothetical protein